MTLNQNYSTISRDRGKLNINKSGDRVTSNETVLIKTPGGDIQVPKTFDDRGRP